MSIIQPIKHHSKHKALTSSSKTNRSFALDWGLKFGGERRGTLVLCRPVKMAKGKQKHGSSAVVGRRILDR